MTGYHDWYMSRKPFTNKDIKYRRVLNLKKNMELKIAFF